VGCYDKLRNKVPRWDKLGRAALEALVRKLNKEFTTDSTLEEVRARAKQAVNTGCDDPMVLYAFAYSSRQLNAAATEQLRRGF
jgi:hypothetical protein